MTLSEKAKQFAEEAHKGQFRKGTDIPYISHPAAVMEIVSSITDDEEIIAAAVLHDTLEDTDTTRGDIESLFGKRVAELVASESENKREGLPSADTWKLRKQETLDRIAAAGRAVRIICLGDKLANMRDIYKDEKSLGNLLWERFNAPDDGRGYEGKKANIARYYRGIADRLKPELGSTPAWQELDKLVTEVFNV